MFNLKVDIKGLQASLEKLKNLPEDKVMPVVKNASQVVVDGLKANYTAGGHYNEKRKSGTHLIDTINTFPKQRKGQDDPFYTHYAGPKFTRFKKGQKGVGAGGQQAVFLEWGTTDRFRANRDAGGVSFGKGRQYGAKSYTGRVPAFGIIRKTSDENEQTVVNILKQGVINVIKQIW